VVTQFSELLRIDPMTGCMNYLGFLETLMHNSLSNTEADKRSQEGTWYWTDASVFSALFFLDMHGLTTLNTTRGLDYGDSALRWMGILLQEESNHQVYRLGGDEFAMLLKIEGREKHLEMVERILERMELEARQFGFPGPAGDIVLIFFDDTPTSLDTILMQMGEAMAKVKNTPEINFKAFDSVDFKIPRKSPETWKSDSEADLSYSVRWLSIKTIYQVLELGRMLDDTQQEAYTDAISGLPNMKAALRTMEKTLESSKNNHRPFSILMIDGDNIRRYNNINYATGDQMIRDMGVVIKGKLRPSDYVARWRTGDEFIIILPDTPIEGAKMIGERFRLGIKEASREWRFPSSISIGIASFPIHGDTMDAVIDQAEAANKSAKEQGKDRVVIAETAVEYSQ
jgi:diguanylate cyclase (GGDEF)-like protein